MILLEQFRSEWKVKHIEQHQKHIDELNEALNKWDEKISNYGIKIELATIELQEEKNERIIPSIKEYLNEMIDLQMRAIDFKNKINGWIEEVNREIRLLQSDES